MGKVISFRQTGDFRKTERLLSGLIGARALRKMHKYGEQGVVALQNATPRDSGDTASAWTYEIVQAPGRTAIYWKNSHVENGVNIAIILRYGHATRNGGFVEGKDYISPAIRPVFEKMADEVWKEVVL